MATDFVNIEKQDAEHPSLGKVLASDGGTTLRDYLFQGIPCLIGIGFLFWFLCIYIPADFRRTVTAEVTFSDSDVSVPITVPEFLHGEETAISVFCLGLIVTASLVFLTAWNFYLVASSKVTVYEKGIVGASPGIVQFYLRKFQLSYDNISSVDSDWNSIRIVVSGVKYRVFVKKPAEIRRIIFSLCPFTIDVFFENRYHLFLFSSCLFSKDSVKRTTSPCLRTLLPHRTHAKQFAFTPMPKKLISELNYFCSNIAKKWTRWSHVRE